MRKIYKLLLALSLATVSVNAATKVVKHKIKNGETLYTVAHKHHTTINEVRKINGMKKGELLKIGRVVKVPTNTYFPNKNKKVVVKKLVKKPTYAIKSGDTLFTIARKHKMTLAELAKINNIKYETKLKLGKKLKVTRKATTKKLKTNKRKSTKKIKIAKVTKKNKKSDRILRSALKKHAQPLASKRVKKRRVLTVDDILFKASQPNIRSFSGFSSKKSKNIIKLAKKKLGKKYVWGAVGQKNTFDCSGLTKYVYKKNGINLPRTSINQSKFGKYVSRSQLKPGDLVFFDTSKKRKGYVNHVGIYIGNGKFLHASSAKKKVVVSNLSKFYAQRYKGARRPS
ncbi:MAG: hypothetical protein COA92_10130 [Sulfurovum sp.]|nr:MAG: hypothetical protein COA92_10130 [Sulfurovum sp.]